jgi:hypothetical protein
MIMSDQLMIHGLAGVRFDDRPPRSAGGYAS